MYMSSNNSQFLQDTDRTFNEKKVFKQKVPEIDLW